MSLIAAHAYACFMLKEDMLIPLPNEQSSEAKQFRLSVFHTDANPLTSIAPSITVTDDKCTLVEKLMISKFVSPLLPSTQKQETRYHLLPIYFDMGCAALHFYIRTLPCPLLFAVFPM